MAAHLVSKRFSPPPPPSLARPTASRNLAALVARIAVASLAVAQEHFLKPLVYFKMRTEFLKSMKAPAVP
jgi:hypothetical protein